jgi:dihydroflavonol-4-reductase
VVHAAADLNYQKQNRDRQAQVNVEGTRHVARACRAEGLRRFLHVSSVAAIGISPDPQRPANEKFPFNLRHSGLTYYVSKQRAEEEVLSEVERGLDACIVNPATLCGPAHTGYRILPAFERTLNHWVIPYSSGGLCGVHVADVVQGILLALQRGRTGERYILGGENVSFRQIGEIVCRQLLGTRILVPVPATVAAGLGKVRNRFRSIFGLDAVPVYDRHLCYQFYDSTKAGLELGYQARPFRAIVEEMLSYARLSARATANRGADRNDILFDAGAKGSRPEGI